MVGPSEIGSALSSLKMIKDIIGGIASLKSEVEVNEVKVQLQRALLEAFDALATAQQTQAERGQEVEKLREEIRKLEDWSGEREKYALRAVPGGAFAYMPHDAAATGEPAHWLCTSCFEVGRKSIMQPISSINGETTWQCQPCKSKFLTFSRTRPTYGEDSR